MEARFARTQTTVGADPHQWHTYEQYRIVNDQRLDEHSFIDRTRQDTLRFEEVEDDEGVFSIHLEGNLYCLGGVTLKIEKWFETRVTPSGLLQVRGDNYRYIGYKRGGNRILKYHNLHEDKDEYFHRIYDPETDQLKFSEVLTRDQFPVMTDVLDELEQLTCVEE